MVILNSHFDFAMYEAKIATEEFFAAVRKLDDTMEAMKNG